MENWNDGSKKLSETMGVIAKRAGEIGSEITNVMNNFVGVSQQMGWYDL